MLQWWSETICGESSSDMKTVEGLQWQIPSHNSLTHPNRWLCQLLGALSFQVTLLMSFHDINIPSVVAEQKRKEHWSTTWRHKCIIFTLSHYCFRSISRPSCASWSRYQHRPFALPPWSTSVNVSSYTLRPHLKRRLCTLPPYIMSDKLLMEWHWVAIAFLSWRSQISVPSFLINLVMSCWSYNDPQSSS